MTDTIVKFPIAKGIANPDEEIDLLNLVLIDTQYI